MITTQLIFWTQVGSIIGFVTTLFILYRILVQQKDATIQLQKENIAFLKDQLAEAKAKSVDALAERLSARVKLLEEELKRIEQDKSSTQEEVEKKEAELEEARAQAEELTERIRHARELLSGFLCPHCGAPLVERAYHSEMVEYKGREIDVDHEHIAYECGYELVDGQERGKCRSFSEKSFK